MNHILGFLPILIISAVALNAGAVNHDTVLQETPAKSTSADSVASSLHFRIGQSTIIAQYAENDIAGDTIINAIRRYNAMGSDFSVDIIGLSSPDGGQARNRQLALERADNSRNYIESRTHDIGKIKFTLRNGGINWKGLRAILQGANDFAGRSDALALLDEILPDGTLPEIKIDQLKRLNGGAVWNRLYTDFFPDLRKALVTVYSPPRTGSPSGLIAVYEEAVDTNLRSTAVSELVVDTVTAVRTEIVENLDSIEPEPSCTIETPAQRPFYMSLGTNMLYDALLLPNIGIEFYLGKHWSVNADWIYGWWSNKKHHRYWRAYGGDIGVRYWLGRAASRKPLTGHHIGVYAQMMLYDFEFGGKGQMCGKPGGNIWEKSNYGGGFEYGYSLPVGRRLNIDFSLGIGYIGGEYYEYKPEDDHYVWLNTKKRRWFGPTKVQISLIWLLGRGNTNKKGGEQ